MLCDRATNSTAFECLAYLQNSDILKIATTACGRFAENSGREPELCLKFLSIFTKTDSARQILLGSTVGFLDTLLHNLDKNFECPHATYKMQESLLNVLTNTLGRTCLSDRCNVDLFVAAGGFRIANEVFEKVYKKAKEVARAFESDNNLIGLLGDSKVINSVLCTFRSVMLR